MGTKHTTVERSKESSGCLRMSGTQLQLSGPDAARHSIQTVKVSFRGTEFEMDAETVQVFMCLLEGFMSQMWSGDNTALAFYSARDYAEKVGVSSDRFVEVANIIFKKNDERRKKNPFVAGGFMS